LSSDLSASLTPYGWSDRWATLHADHCGRHHTTAAMPARIVRHDGRAVLVATATATTSAGIRSLPVLATVDPPPVVGDWVVTTEDAVVATLPRT
jgi:hypothetical protein